MPYLVRHLNIADYIFLTRTRRGLAREFVAPVLIERKSVEDVACSISDGRWLAQQRRMMAARQIGGDYAGCRLVYIIEGDAKQRRVHGGGVGRANLHLSLEQVELPVSQARGLRLSRRPVCVIHAASWDRFCATWLGGKQLFRACPGKAGRV